MNQIKFLAAAGYISDKDKKNYFFKVSLMSKQKEERASHG